MISRAGRLFASAAFLALGILDTFGPMFRPPIEGAVSLPSLFWLIPIGVVCLAHTLSRSRFGVLASWLLGIGAYVIPGLIMCAAVSLTHPHLADGRGGLSLLGLLANDVLLWPWLLRLLMMAALWPAPSATP